MNIYYYVLCSFSRFTFENCFSCCLGRALTFFIVILGVFSPMCWSLSFGGNIEECGKFIFIVVKSDILYLVDVLFTTMWASLVAQLMKNLPAMQETWVQSLSWEDALEKEMAPFQYSCLENFMAGGAWQATVLRVAKSQTWLAPIKLYSIWLVWT